MGTGPEDSRDGVDPEPVLDPRTWGRAGPGLAAPGGPTEPAPAEPEPSLDVRDWGRRPSADDPPSDRPRPDRRWLIGGGAALGVTGLVGIAALAGGKFKPHPRPSSEPGATGAATAERRVLRLGSGAELAKALTDQGILQDQASAAAALAQPALKTSDSDLRLEIRLRRDGQGSGLGLIGLVLQRPDGSGVAVSADAGGRFHAQVLGADLRPVIRVARGQMDNESFYASAVAAGVNDSLIPEFAQAFAFDFDFQREIKPGDVFETAYEEQVNSLNQPAGAKRLLYAALSTAAKSRALYRFAAPGEEEGWFDGAGRSNRRGLMRTPVEGARISSGFGMRDHPILGFQKLHKGTDFAAPIGTPIYAAGDGVVDWAAMKGPNGNLVIVKHDNGWETYYLHMSAFGAGIVPGVRVRQGQEIGEVGTTGRSTGPHLHYELHVNGEAVDAMAVKLDAGKSLAGAALAAFTVERDRIDALRRSSL